MRRFKSTKIYTSGHYILMKYFIKYLPNVNNSYYGFDLMSNIFLYIK